MTCSVAMPATSPAFSPSRISPFKTSPETLTLTHLHHHQSDGSPASTSPFRSRLSTCSSLKRKRPAMINIPPAIEALDFAPPSVAGRADGWDDSEVEMDGSRWSVYCKRGRRRLTMEDRYKADLDLSGDPQFAFFGIFDGHGGSKAAEFASENLGKHVVDEVRNVDGEENLEEAVRNGYMKTDSELLKEDVGGGTCCVTALVKEGILVVSNTGDCRAVLSVSGTAEALTVDHKPSRDDERERIQSLGGFVDNCRGVWRVQGSLAVSRALGDSLLKEWVIPDPETRILAIQPEFEFLILASDGLWDKVGNQEAIDVARPLCIEPHNQSTIRACRRLAELATSRGSLDDISVMIIQLKQFIRNDSC